MVGVRDLGSGFAGIVQNALDLELVAERLRRVLALLGRAAAEGAVGPVAVIGLQRHDRQRLGEPGIGRRLAVIVALVPVRVDQDRRRPDIEPGDQLSVGLGRADHRHRLADHVGIARCPFIGLQRTHRGTSDHDELVDPKTLDQGLLDIDEIADGHDREIERVRLAGIGIDRGRACGRGLGVACVEVHQRVGGEDEILVGINRLAGADDRVPVAGSGIGGGIFAGGVRIGREEMADQDRVGFVGVERAVALPADLDVLQRAPALRGVARQREDFLLDQKLLRVRHSRHHHAHDTEHTCDPALHAALLRSGRVLGLERDQSGFVRLTEGGLPSPLGGEGPGRGMRAPRLGEPSFPHPSALRAATFSPEGRRTLLTASPAAP